MSEYIRVRPTSEEVDPGRISRVLQSLHKLQPKSETRWQKLNPFHGTPAPRFEFLILSDGLDAPIEFLYGVDNGLDTLEKRVKSIYPSTFQIKRLEVDLSKRLIEPERLTQAEFLERYEASKLAYDFGPDEVIEITDTDLEVTTVQVETEEGESATVEHVGDGFVRIGEQAFKFNKPVSLPDDGPLTEIEKPTITEGGMILARPAVDAASPLGVRWSGSATRKRDWMTSLTPITAPNSSETVQSVTEPGAALTSLIDHLTNAETPVAFQVVFERYPDWQDKADLRKEDLVDGRDTFLGRLIGPWLGTTEDPSRRRRKERHLSTSVSKRIEYLDIKNAKRSYTANIRAIALPTEENRDSCDDWMDSLTTVLDPLDGPFYELKGNRIRDRGIRGKTKERKANAELRRLLDRELVTGRGKTRPDLILCGAELANFVLVPSSHVLSVAGKRGTRATQQSQHPLQQPNPDMLAEFDDGMSIGYPLDENGEPSSEPIRIPPQLLTTHYMRVGPTGAGKSISIESDLQTIRRTTHGPNIVIDAKGDGMCREYLQCHYSEFGNLDNVYYFNLPDILPAFTFFDIRGTLNEGRTREDAIQDKVDHFHEILRMILGEETHDSAYVSKQIISSLIKALFDKEFGSDVFDLSDLIDAANIMQTEKTIPPISTDNDKVEEELIRHFSNDEKQFQNIMNGVGNRLHALTEKPHIYRIFTHNPGSEDTDSHFDFRDILEEDITILFDTGELRPESQKAFTLLVLSNLWDAVQVRKNDGRSDYEYLTNVIIEESAPIVSSTIVSEQLLPMGRSFGLCLGLVMQFPEQVRDRSERAYKELLNNVRTKLISNITPDKDLARSMVHEDLDAEELRNRLNSLPKGEWIAKLPSPKFGDAAPSPFSLKPLPIPPGHPESEHPLTESQKEHFENTAYPTVLDRTQALYGIDRELSEGSGWGSAETGSSSSNTPDSVSSDLSQSSFIDQQAAVKQPLSDESPFSQTDETTPDSTPDTDPSFGVLGEADEANSSPESSVTEATEPPENGSSPVKYGGISVPDDELQNRGLTRDDIRFLDHVLEVMNRESSEYTLLDAMRSLRDEFEDLDLQRLREQGLLDEASAAGRKYYTVLPAGRELLGKKLRVGPGKGDIGEKTPHKVGVKLLEVWIGNQDDVVRVEPYYQHSEDAVFDVAGFDVDDTLIWAGEAELHSHNREAPIDDYDKLSDVDAHVVWAFNKRETAIEVLDWLADADRIEASVSGRDARSFTSIRDTIEEFDAAGLTTIRSFKNLDTEVNS
ncbi:ATP-binding protein [Halopenitus salinus]|uniref:ATP-binding protein n=1 Tax=Halopenitus salinus TaxID=1198295 RepID=A0ABD5V405_9EURY